MSVEQRLVRGGRGIAQHRVAERIDQVQAACLRRRHVRRSRAMRAAAPATPRRSRRTATVRSGCSVREELAVAAVRGDEEHALDAIHVLVQARSATAATGTAPCGSARRRRRRRRTSIVHLPRRKFARNVACRPRRAARLRQRHGRIDQVALVGAADGSPARGAVIEPERHGQRHEEQCGEQQQAGVGRGVASAWGSVAFIDDREPRLREPRSRRLSATKMTSSDDGKREPLERVTEVALGAETERGSPDALVTVRQLRDRAAGCAIRPARRSACSTSACRGKFSTRGHTVSPATPGFADPHAGRGQSIEATAITARSAAPTVTVGQHGAASPKRHPAAIDQQQRGRCRRGPAASARGSRAARPCEGMLSSRIWRAGS